MPLSVSTRRWIVVAAIVVYWTILFVFTHLPGDPRPESPHQKIPHLDKLVHAAAFAGLAVLALVAAESFRRVSLPLVFTVAGLLTIYAAFDELTQGLIRFRVPDYRDWVADVLGITVGSLLFWTGRRLWTSDRGETVTARATK
ncbi:MAG TPA: VanZ family protein [Pirellulales bacterium]|nr:VanZ family protein [Pirellulales bacterium]